jgi:hypothetical protein
MSLIFFFELYRIFIYFILLLLLFFLSYNLTRGRGDLHRTCIRGGIEERKPILVRKMI